MAYVVVLEEGPALDAWRAGMARAFEIEDGETGSLFDRLTGVYGVAPITAGFLDERRTAVVLSLLEQLAPGLPHQEPGDRIQGRAVA